MKRLLRWPLLLLLAVAGMAPEVAFIVAHGRFGSGADVLNWVLGL